MVGGISTFGPLVASTSTTLPSFPIATVSSTVPSIPWSIASGGYDGSVWSVSAPKWKLGPSSVGAPFTPASETARLDVIAVVALALMLCSVWLTFDPAPAATTEVAALLVTPRVAP